jgi:uncharacterized membrane-anchored protein YhcB (DUF1043 family)
MVSAIEIRQYMGLNSNLNFHLNKSDWTQDISVPVPKCLETLRTQCRSVSRHFGLSAEKVKTLRTQCRSVSRHFGPNLIPYYKKTQKLNFMIQNLKSLTQLCSLDYRINSQ